MAKTWEGRANASDPDGGFRKAAVAAVENYKADNGALPTQLKVTEMYVEVRNPIHQYIVVLGPGG
jgi:hypothetical protein